MPAYPTFPTKDAAISYVASMGYTVHCGTSASGDHGHGSREYFTGPDAVLNPHGWPLNTMNVSRVGRRWYVA